MQILTGSKKEAGWLAFSPDGRYLAACEARALHVWDPAAGTKPVWSAKHPLGNNPKTFCFTADGQSLVRRYDTRIFHRHDVRTGKWETDNPLTTLNPFLFSSDGLFAVRWEHIEKNEIRMLCARADGSGGWAEVWRREFAYGAGGYPLIELSPCSKTIGRVYQRGAYRSVTEMGVELLDLASGQPVGEWEGELPCHLQKCAVSLTGAVVVLNSRNFYTVETSTPRAEPVRRQNASPQHFTSAAFSRDGSRLATTSNDTAATIWDTATWEVRRRYEWQIGRLRTVCFAPDGLRCAAGSDSGQVVVWDLDD